MNGCLKCAGILVIKISINIFDFINLFLYVAHIYAKYDFVIIAFQILNKNVLKTFSFCYKFRQTLSFISMFTAKESKGKEINGNVV